jgi:hypothetical protein
MSVITIKRIVTKPRRINRPTTRRPFRELARKFFAGENYWEFAIEALFFAVLLATSAWPMILAASAINEVFRTFVS